MNTKTQPALAERAAQSVTPYPSQPSAQGSESHALMRMIEQAVQRDDFDVDKLKALLAVKKEWEENEARKAYVAAMAAFKAEPIVIAKNKQVTMNLKDRDNKPAGKLEFAHADLAEVVDAVVPAMAKHGLSHRWDIRQEGSIISVDCVITHALGHSQKVSMHGLPDDTGRKNAIQQVASTVSYLQRYTLMSACGVAAKGIDNDGNGDGAGESEVERAAADKRQAWIDAINGCVDTLELTARKKELIDSCGGIDNVPEELINICVTKKAALEKSAGK